MRMKAEDKAKWLEALRSGEYKQTDNTLSNGTAYCCLGVLETILDGDVERLGDNTPRASPTCNFLVRHDIEVELLAGRDGWVSGIELDGDTHTLYALRQERPE